MEAILDKNYPPTTHKNILSYEQRICVRLKEHSSLSLKVTLIASLKFLYFRPENLNSYLLKTLDHRS